MAEGEGGSWYPMTTLSKVIEVNIKVKEGETTCLEMFVKSKERT